MSVLSVFDPREKVVGNKGEKVVGNKGVAAAACPYCGGPVVGWDFEAHLLFCFIPISHKTKRKFYCAICSARLVPAAS